MNEEMFLIVVNYIYIKTCHLFKKKRKKKCFVLNHFYGPITISDTHNGITCNKHYMYLEFFFQNIFFNGTKQ